MSPLKNTLSLVGWENREVGHFWTQISKFIRSFCYFQPLKSFPCCHLGMCVHDYRDSVWSAWRQTCLLCCHAKMKGWIPLWCQTALYFFFTSECYIFSIWLQQRIELWTLIVPTFAFFSQVECKQHSDAVLARKWGQAFPGLPIFIMKRLCECISKLSFLLTQPCSPSGNIHASEKTGDEFLEKLKWQNL